MRRHWTMNLVISSASIALLLLSLLATEGTYRWICFQRLHRDPLALRQQHLIWSGQVGYYADASAENPLLHPLGYKIIDQRDFPLTTPSPTDYRVLVLGGSAVMGKDTDRENNWSWVTLSALFVFGFFALLLAVVMVYGLGFAFFGFIQGWENVMRVITDPRKAQYLLEESRGGLHPPESARGLPRPVRRAAGRSASRRDASHPAGNHPGVVARIRALGGQGPLLRRARAHAACRPGRRRDDDRSAGRMAGRRSLDLPGLEPFVHRPARAVHAGKEIRPSLTGRTHGHGPGPRGRRARTGRRR